MHRSDGLSFIEVVNHPPSHGDFRRYRNGSAKLSAMIHHDGAPTVEDVRALGSHHGKWLIDYAKSNVNLECQLRRPNDATISNPYNLR